MSDTFSFERHRWLALLLLLSLVFCLFGCSGEEKTNAKASQKPVLRIGLEAYLPFVYIDDSGRPAGIDVDIAKEACRRLGYTPQFVVIDWDKRDELLEKGEIDGIWCCYSMREREGLYHWAGPYMMSRMVVAVSATGNIRHVSELNGKRVAVRSNTKAERILSHDEVPGLVLSDLYTFLDRDLVYTSLYKGYVDGLASHEAAILQYMKDTGIAFRILPEPLEITGVGVAFHKNDNRPIVDDLGRTLQTMADDGTTEQILRKYVDAPESFLKGVRHE